MSRTTSSPIISASIVFGLLLGGFALSSASAAPPTSEAEQKNTELTTSSWFAGMCVRTHAR